MQASKYLPVILRDWNQQKRELFNFVKIFLPSPPLYEEKEVLYLTNKGCCDTFGYQSLKAGMGYNCINV